MKICFFTMILLLTTMSLPGQPYTFRKINSGTKADIRNISKDLDQGLYFVTDKIYTLQQDAWHPAAAPVDGKIYYFSALSPRDYWFNVNHVTNTCFLYHVHNGITEHIHPPLSNSITSMYFISESVSLFAGYADIAAYEHGSFRLLPPSPARSSIIRIFGETTNDFYILTGGGEMFRFEQGNYKEILHGLKVTDFCFSDMDHGYILSGDKLYCMDAGRIYLAGTDPDYLKVRKIQLTPDGTVLMVGDKGLILSYFAQRLSRHEGHCKDNLTDVVVAGPDDIWICGENGRLLYHGSKSFPEYIEDNQGFSSHKLIVYGINTDDEYGVALADFNGDLTTDIYAVRIYEQNRLYMNKLAPSTKMIAESGFAEEAVKRNALGVIPTGADPVHSELKLGIGAADIDNDNDQDIYLCYLNSTNKLLLNRGNGIFRDVSGQENRACENLQRSNTAAFADVDNDGDLDLFVTSEEGSNRLFENDGTGHFTDITTNSGLASTGGGMCATFSDVNDDGYSDLFVSFWYPSNKLFVNETKPGRIRFRDVTNLSDLGRAVPSKSNGVVFADVNNDGFSDLFIANRNNGNKLYLNDGKGFFADKTQDFFQSGSVICNGAVFADFDLDGYQDLYVTNVGENVLYKNMHGSSFKDVTAIFGAELSGYCTGCATGDIDNDGDADLYVANYINGNSSLFLNNTEKKNFVRFNLYGVRSNRDAIGAKVWLYKVIAGSSRGLLAGYREMTSGSGYASVSAKEMIFGVDGNSVYYALVKFPSSADTLRLDRIAAGNFYKVYELKGYQAFYTEAGNAFRRFFMDREKQPEIIKFLLVGLLLVVYNLKLRKSYRNIAILRWLTSSFIFVVFIFVNQAFIFQWFSVAYFIAPIVVAGLLAIEYLFIDRILLKKLVQKENRELREKLSRDLHDDLASTLGSISIYAETLKGLKDDTPDGFVKLPVKIADLTQTALHSISDIIWMTSPRNDSLQSLASKASNYMLEILRDNKIGFRAYIDMPESPVVLQEKIRNNAFLILKEAVHNILRHSGATNVVFRVAMEENVCTISLKDDGVGMADNRSAVERPQGNGLLNMRKRCQESGIELGIHSQENIGTEIVLRFKI